MEIHLRELESIADDAEELANEFQSFARQQALLNKVARIYDVACEIRHEVKELGGHA
jgi:hypothetical protein